MSWKGDRAKTRIREHLKTVLDLDSNIALDSAQAQTTVRKSRPDRSSSDPPGFARGGRSRLWPVAGFRRTYHRGRLRNGNLASQTLAIPQHALSCLGHRRG